MRQREDLRGESVIFKGELDFTRLTEERGGRREHCGADDESGGEVDMHFGTVWSSGLGWDVEELSSVGYVSSGTARLLGAGTKQDKKETDSVSTTA